MCAASLARGAIENECLHSGCLTKEVLQAPLSACTLKPVVYPANYCIDTAQNMDYCGEDLGKNLGWAIFVDVVLSYSLLYGGNFPSVKLICQSIYVSFKQESGCQFSKKATIINSGNHVCFHSTRHTMQRVLGVVWHKIYSCVVAGVLSGRIHFKEDVIKKEPT